MPHEFLSNVAIANWKFLFKYPCSLFVCKVAVLIYWFPLELRIMGSIYASLFLYVSFLVPLFSGTFVAVELSNLEKVIFDSLEIILKTNFRVQNFQFESLFLK